MSRLKQQRVAKKLKTLIERTDKQALLEAIWVLDRASSDANFSGIQGYSYPREVFGNPDIDNKLLPHSWELETLVTETFRWRRKPGPREGNPKGWAFIAELVNKLRELENEQFGADPNKDVRREFFRIGHRQFRWQSSWNAAECARWWSIFSNQELGLIFERRVGLSLDVFVAVALGWNLLFNRHMRTRLPTNDNVPNLTDMDFKVFADYVSIPFGQAESRSQAIAESFKSVAYRESLLRSHPIVYLPGEPPAYLRPIEKPLLWRITTGLYYDVINELQARNLIGREFEAYVHALLKAKFSAHHIREKITYGSKARPRESPDVLIVEETSVRAAFECKATKVPFTVQTSFGESEHRGRVIGELANGIVQLARFDEDLASGKVEGLNPRDQILLVVVTLDDWVFLGKELKDEVLDAAVRVAKSKGSAPETISQRGFGFCTAGELEYLVSAYSSDDVLAVLRAAAQEAKYFGYSVLGISHEQFADRKRELGYPLPELAERMFARFLPSDDG